MKASLRAHLVAAIVRHRVKPRLGDMSDLARVRKVLGQSLPAPRGVSYTDAVVGGVAGEWVEAKSNAVTGKTTLLYLHGGGFIGCSPRTHRPITAALALQGLRVFVPDYRLAPEHAFPAAPRDVQAAYRALRADPAINRLVVAGDSAGGNLALGLMLELRDADQQLPDAAALFSPAVDLTCQSPSITLNAERDPMFYGPYLRHLTDAYLQGADASQPLASPLLGELTGLPPLLIHVGESECLRDDALRLAQKAREAGVSVELQVFSVVPHVWQVVHDLSEARHSIAAAGRFLREAQRLIQPETLDVVIIGAGLSGVGAAVHLQRECPKKTVTLLEARATMGGTWDLFRYPGVRSDSDMYTLGYDFKPWRGAKAIADGPSILRYVQETAAEEGIAQHIRYGHRVVAADWSAEHGHWTLSIERSEGRGLLTVRARFVLFCAGYYSYAQGHSPHFLGKDRFQGTVVHPQFWPEGLDHSGKQVVVIGSGATAVTLVPEMARTAAHVTMLQRSPTYVVARPASDPIAEKLKRWLPARLAYALVRAKNVLIGMYFYRLARKYPRQTQERITAMVREAVGPGIDVERHFKPSYMPWDQRLCLVPDGDLFKSLRFGSASVVTDQIESFTEHGIRLVSGQELPADIIVTATGLQMNVMGDVKISLDGRAADLTQGLVYKGLMQGGLPNMANTMGYTNASWTLKADLTARYVCRLLKHMDRHGLSVCTPVPDASVQPEPILSFSSGYVQRGLAVLPKQGDRKPWRLDQNYLLDMLTLRFKAIDDGVLSFGRCAVVASAQGTITDGEESAFHHTSTHPKRKPHGVQRQVEDQRTALESRNPGVHRKEQARAAQPSHAGDDE
jgi:cation diffusion facilitator CzcD-associated flavoprotein CzcO/acetyl esterase/lipase